MAMVMAVFIEKQKTLDWIEQGLTSPPTQYRLSRRQFYRKTFMLQKKRLRFITPMEETMPSLIDHS